ncbi:MAG: RES domain-containing protein [Gammaproteobacteria bacterium]|nr:RES domain-containing protein [Gammaproteobacteria bacterium]
MGQAKADFDMVQGRGWYSIDAFVCPDCVEDDFLRILIRDNAESNACDYCGATVQQNIAAPIDVITEAVARAVHANFADPAEAGVPYESAEGGYQGMTFDTDEALRRLPFDAQDNLFEAISDAFTNDLWTSAPGGHWLGSARHDVLRDAWEHFVLTVKHESRYFFGAPNRFVAPELREFSEPDIFETLADLVRESLIQTVPAGTSFFRTRYWPDPPDWAPDVANMGAPPTELASAGRMNPAGISYLYLAFEEPTAIAEIFRGPPAKLAIAHFKATRELTLLDLNTLPDRSSVFDDDLRHEREAVLFIEGFAEAISRPVTRDGSEHIDYVPSQVVSEYFRLIFALGGEGNGSRLDGIAYPSAVRPGGRNVVLFPTRVRFEREFEQVAFESSWELKLATWADAYAAIR